MRRFFAPKEKISSKEIILSPEETHHLFCVDRFKEGDTVLVFDGDETEYEAVITGERNKSAVLEIKNKVKKIGSPYNLRMAVCLPKKAKFENIIEKCTELNVSEIIPLMSKRTVVKIDKAKAGIKRTRWQKKALESAKQAGRVKFPEIKEARDFKDFIKTLNKESFILIPTLYSSKSFKEALKNIKDFKNIVILIGPEGGFELDEVKSAEEAGAVAVSLGNTVLRVETAVIFVAAVINYETQS
ncbi:MAG: RsmE family RNA methyltransferase [Candidatus Omnitrophota bacterium]